MNIESKHEKPDARKGAHPHAERPMNGTAKTDSGGYELVPYRGADAETPVDDQAQEHSGYPITDKKAALLREIDALLVANGWVVYPVPMPSRVHVLVRDFNKPHVVENGQRVTKSKKAGDLVVRDARGKQIGWFDKASVIGWSVEREPVDGRKATDEELEYFVADVRENGLLNAAGQLVTAKGNNEPKEAIKKTSRQQRPAKA
jgi:hypothetical protein